MTLAGTFRYSNSNSVQFAYGKRVSSPHQVLVETVSRFSLGAMKYFLLGSQCCCFFLLASSGIWRRYLLLVGFLGAQIAAALLYTPGTDYYTWIAGPVLVLRFAATLEVTHRQTSHFRYWSGLTAGVILLALFYTASVMALPVDFVGFRRALQIWCAAYFFVLEVFWVTQRFWWPSLPNCIAACFGLGLLNHGAVALAGVVLRWDWLTWWRAVGWSWGAEAVSWLALGSMNS